MIIKKNKQIKPLFIGFGKQAREYAKVFKYLDIEITSVCVTDLKRNKDQIDFYKIKNKYDNISKALKEGNYNSVFVFLPWNLIDKKIIHIIKNTKKIIFTEKPIALSIKKLLKINAASNKYNKKIHVLYNRRFYKIFSLIQKKINTNKYFFHAHIPERLDHTLKNIDNKLKGKIKYHLSSHWFDFFMKITNKKITNFFKYNKTYNFILDNNKNYNKSITLKYNDFGMIKSKFIIGNNIYILDTLEKLKIYDKKTNKLKMSINEHKLNKFKPGVYFLIKKLIDGNFKNIPKLSEVISLYKVIENLPH